jgi:Protein of unknown function (DUF5818)
MRKTLLLTLFLLVCAAWVVAQQGAASQAAASGPTTVEGCLGGAAGNFTLTDMAGTTYQLQLPSGADTAKLNQHIGHEVRVTGTMSNPTASDSMNPSASQPGQAPGGSAARQPTISVSKMDKIADTCSNAAGTPSK